jgi:hypothetical protein
MKKVILFLFFVNLIACKSNMNTINSIPDGKYRGRFHSYDLRVKVQNDTAILKFIIGHGGGAKLLTDTIYTHESNCCKWEGNFSTIIKSKNKIYVESPDYYFKDEIIKIKIRQVDKF